MEYANERIYSLRAGLQNWQKQQICQLFVMPDQSFIETPAGRHLKSRVDAVMRIYKEHGHVNRTLISEKLELTKLQSSQLLREFLSAHAPVLEWDTIHNSYRAHSKFKVH